MSFNTLQTDLAGVIMDYGGDSVPANSGWLMCDGRAYRSADYPALYAVIGESWGNGTDKQGGDPTDADFNVPDLRGVTPRGKADGQSTDPGRVTRTTLHTGGATGDNVGSYQSDSYKSHSHLIRVVGDSINGGSETANESANPTSNNASTSASIGGQSDNDESRPENLYVNFIIKY